MAHLGFNIDELDILGNINIVNFYIYFINKWTNVSISPPYPVFIIKIYIFNFKNEYILITNWTFVRGSALYPFFIIKIYIFI